MEKSPIIISGVLTLIAILTAAKSIEATIWTETVPEPESKISQSVSEKLVIDTDAGGDDAGAILLVTSAWAHQDSNFELIAITCVHGNTAEENVERNVLKTITIANASHIPVYGGARKPLMHNFTTDNFFGYDGFGDFNFTEKITAEVNRSTYAAIALINLAKQYKGELNILALGPLTNIALAISLDSEFLNNVKRFYIMGGSVEGIGNKAPNVEFNFDADPESNFIVLNATWYTPSLLLPWETIMKANISKTWRREILGSINSRIINFLNQADKICLAGELPFWPSADAMTAAVMMWPDLVKKSLVTNVNPVCSGVARGSILVDYTGHSGNPKNVEIIQKIDVAGYLKKLLQHFY